MWDVGFFLLFFILSFLRIYFVGYSVISSSELVFKFFECVLYWEGRLSVKKDFVWVGYFWGMCRRA